MAYQLHHPEMDEGAVVVFRRQESPMAVAYFNLKGLTESATYEFEDADTKETFQLTAEELEMSGLEIKIPTPRTARLLFYKKIS